MRYGTPAWLYDFSGSLISQSYFMFVANVTLTFLSWFLFSPYFLALEMLGDISGKVQESPKSWSKKLWNGILQLLAMWLWENHITEGCQLCKNEQLWRWNCEIFLLSSRVQMWKSWWKRGMMDILDSHFLGSFLKVFFFNNYEGIIYIQ